MSGLFERLNGLMGGIAVGGFFFLSAYGLVKSYMKNPYGYAKRMLLIKIPLIYLIQISINLIYYLAIFRNSGQSAGNTVLQILSLDIFANLPRINGYSWFITTILFIYIFFTLSILTYKLFKKHIKKNKLFIVIITSVLILAYFYIFKFVPNLSGLYTRSIFCFVLGLVYSFNSDTVNRWLLNKKIYYPALGIIVAAIVLMFFFAPKERIISLFVCLLMIVVFQKITFEKNVPLKMLGEISLEIYLLQLLCITLLAFDYSSNQFIKGLAIFGSTIAISFIYHMAYIAVTNSTKFLILKIKKEKENSN